MCVAFMPSLLKADHQTPSIKNSVIQDIIAPAQPVDNDKDGSALLVAFGLHEYCERVVRVKRRCGTLLSRVADRV